MNKLKSFISFPVDHLYESVQHNHYIIVNIEGVCVMRATLSDIPHNEYKWRLTELSYCEDLENKQDVFRKLIDSILKDISDTNNYFYIEVDNNMPSVIKDCPWISCLEDNIYVCKATSH
ncbi:MAG: hypothetical protein E7139_07380 [Rikenellaceae bacterium]|nr:hypothetical protein [Rikenellaceae bacterium]